MADPSAHARRPEGVRSGQTACERCGAYMGVPVASILTPELGRALAEHGYSVVHHGPVDPQECYECGVHVCADRGQQHGRAGWVHNDCLT